MNKTVDKFGRILKYLRISVTDRCNFRCKYCVPEDKPFEQLDCKEILRYEDMLFIVEQFAELGVERIRVTGGEPLVRKNLIYFLGELTAIKGIKDVSLTTNGTLLNKYAEGLYSAGVKRLNISLDSLREDRFRYITGGYSFEGTMSGIEKVRALGFAPIKINVVAIKGFNDDEIYDFCQFAAAKNVIVRFIEFMPIGNSLEWKKENIISGKEIIEHIGKKYEVKALPKNPDAGPARNFELSNGAQIGIITPISEHFCGECDKIRLTADGKLRPCLLSDKEYSIAEAAASKDKDALRLGLTAALGLKDVEHTVVIGDNGEFKRTMSKIGG